MLNQIIRGVVYDFSSIELQVAGKTSFCTVQEINYTWSREIGVLRGTCSPKKRGRTRGQFDFTGSITLAKEDVAEFHGLLAALGFGGFGEAVFDIIISYSKRLDPFVNVDKLIGATLVGGDDSHSQSADPLVVKYDLDIMDITYNGLSPVASDSLPQVGGLLV